MTPPNPDATPNKAWSTNDPSIVAQDKAGLSDPDAGLRSADGEALGTDKYKDPQTDADPLRRGA